MSTICGARLFPLKKDKVGGVRPIAVGEVLRRVTEKILSKLPLTTESMTALLPLQTAFAGRSACEQVGLTVQALVTRTPDTAGWLLCQIDISNAFNTVSRAAILKGVAAGAPHLLPWAAQSLQPSSLFCGTTVIPSEEGGQQGAPLSPLFFALAIHEAISSCPPVARNLWYLDDGSLFGDPASLHHALVALQPSLAGIGCLINWKKTTIWGPGIASASQWPEHIPLDSPLRLASLTPYSRESGVKVLGIPIHGKASTQFVRDCLEEQLAKQQKALDRLGALPDAQVQHRPSLLLRRL